MALLLAAAAALTVHAPVYTLQSYRDCRGGAAHKTLPLGTVIRVDGRQSTVTRRPGWPRSTFHTQGRASVFTDDARTASGRTGGISTWHFWALGGYWRVVAPNGTIGVWRQNDRGPARFTGRWLDITPQAVTSFGYSFSGFPTDRGTWHGYFLGYRLPRGVIVGRQAPLTALGLCAPPRRVRFTISAPRPSG